MIQIDEQLCTGCGTCVDVCPRGAISLDGGVATWLADRCNDCGACVDACPQRAILLVETVAPETETLTKRSAVRVPAPVATAPPSPLATRRSPSLWPLMGAFLRWAGTELAPRLADVALEVWSRRTAGGELSRAQGLGIAFASRPWRHRHRQRERQ
ncbi:MAG: ATP-binding protein [Anaerolineae bacterium]